MKFCNQCGGPLRWGMPPDDNRERFICEHCSHIHYQNPRIIVGCLPLWEDKVLLCKRAIEPRKGLWTLPAGFMENGETILEGALRETWEEAQARVEVNELYRIFNLPHISQVYLLFRGHLSEPRFAPGIESLEVELFSEENIPWNNLAFPIVDLTLKAYFNDRKTGSYIMRVEDIVRR